MSVTPERLSESLAGHYRIERELGAGGMATVYLAHDLRHDRLVALKVVKPEIVATVGADRFVNEIRTIAHLRHPHILPLFDSGRVDAALFYVMPYIDGESLRARLRREGQLSLGDTMTILRELADALAYAHAQNVVHRDIKPDNVLLAGRHVFLADFGIARALEAGASFDQTMTQRSTILGTPTYMSPEQAAGSHLDHRTDIYAFGVLAYEMLTGGPPFTGNTAAVVMAAHLTALPDPLVARRPDVPPALAALVMKCLAKKSDDRWQRMDDVLLGFDTASATLPGGVQPNRQPRHFAVSAGVATIGAVLLACWKRVAVVENAHEPPLAIGAIKHVTRDPGLELDPALSPDGQTLAFVSGPPGERRLYVRQIDDGRAIALTDASVAQSQRRPDWSPDGTRIVFQAGMQGFGVRPAGAQRRALHHSGTRRHADVAAAAAWHRRGADAGVVSRRQSGRVPCGRRHLCHPDTGGSPRQVVKSSQAAHSARWSPDSARLAYVVGGLNFVLGEEQLGNTETSSIRILTVATGADQTVTSGQWLDISPVWTKDGRGLLFVSNQSGGRDVYRLRLSADGFRKATRNA